MQIFIGCASKDCDGNDCASCKTLKQHVRTVDNCQLLTIRPRGVRELFGPRTKLTVTQPVSAGDIDDNTELDLQLCKLPLCDRCSRLDFAALAAGRAEQEVVADTFWELYTSSGSCSLCALLASALPDGVDFVSDDRRPVVLRGTAVQSMLKISFPSLEDGNEVWVAERVGDLQVYSVSEG